MLRRDTGVVHDGGIEVDQLRQRRSHADIDRTAFRRLDQQRHSRQDILKGILRLFRQTEVSREITVVGQEDDQGIVIDAGILQSVDDHAEQIVNIGALGKIHPLYFFPCFFRHFAKRREIPQPVDHL